MNKWVVVSAVAVSATAAVLALTNPVRDFRTTAYMVGVTQKADSIHPQYEYVGMDGSNLVALALGVNPTSNQVFAMSIDCGSSGATLMSFDKSNSNMVAIATCDSLQIVQNRGAKFDYVNSERFVGQFAVQSTGNIAGGMLTVAGRLDLDTNGCPVAVLIKVDKDPQDNSYGDTAVPDMDQDASIKNIYTAGRGHMVGWINIVSGSDTNVMLIPLGHLTFLHQLEQYDVVP